MLHTTCARRATRPGAPRRQLRDVGTSGLRTGRRRRQQWRRWRWRRCSCRSSDRERGDDLRQELKCAAASAQCPGGGGGDAAGLCRSRGVAAAELAEARVHAAAGGAELDDLRRPHEHAQPVAAGSKPVAARFCRQRVLSGEASATALHGRRFGRRPRACLRLPLPALDGARLAHDVRPAGGVRACVRGGGARAGSGALEVSRLLSGRVGRGHVASENGRFAAACLRGARGS